MRRVGRDAGGGRRVGSALGSLSLALSFSALASLAQNNRPGEATGRTSPSRLSKNGMRGGGEGGGLRPGKRRKATRADGVRVALPPFLPPLRVDPRRPLHVGCPLRSLQAQRGVLVRRRGEQTTH